VRRALERALRLENHEVTLAADGEEALDALATTQADAVILDCPSYTHLVYRPGVPLVGTTVIAGRVEFVHQPD